MPSMLSRTICIDEEWAATQIVLRMRVPDNWWDVRRGIQIYEGWIAAVDFADESEGHPDL